MADERHPSIGIIHEDGSREYPKLDVRGGSDYPKPATILKLDKKHFCVLPAGFTHNTESHLIDELRAVIAPRARKQKESADAENRSV